MCVLNAETMSNSQHTSGTVLKTPCLAECEVLTFKATQLFSVLLHRNQELRHRKRTFIMPELEPAHNTNTVLVLLETHPGMSDAMYMLASPSKRNTLLSMAASSWGKADHLMRSVMRRALYQGSEQAQSNDS